MEYLYVNNFKGFSNTLIPITDVNFLVGENSTGKTTILNLFYLLNGTNFWGNLDFDREDVTFGAFKEIISLKSKEPCFNIGFAETSGEKKCLLLLTFSEKDQFPSLCQLNFIKESREIEFHIEDQEVNYLNKKIDYPVFSEEFIFDKVKKWTEKDRNVRYTANKPRTPNREHFGILVELFYSYGFRNIPNPNFLRLGRSRSVAGIAPIRSKPKRTYDKYNVSFTPEGEHIPYILREILTKKDQSSSSFKQLVTEIGKNSGLFDDLKLRKFSEEPGSPFSIDIVQNGMDFNIINTGYGVSQSLPIIVELITKSKESTFTIQQPEVHLHPRAQAALGNLIFYLADKENKKFLIETHSDFIIDRFRLNLKRCIEETKINSHVLFFQKTDMGNSVISIPINKFGEYNEKQPKEFREFFINESLSLLEI
jgi:predicted ATP-dependent endonuclease of OLD family